MSRFKAGGSPGSALAVLLRQGNRLMSRSWVAEPREELPRGQRLKTAGIEGRGWVRSLRRLTSLELGASGERAIVPVTGVGLRATT